MKYTKSVLTSNRDHWRLVSLSDHTIFFWRTNREDVTFLVGHNIDITQFMILCCVYDRWKGTQKHFKFILEITKMKCKEMWKLHIGGYIKLLGMARVATHPRNHGLKVHLHKYLQIFLATLFV